MWILESSEGMDKPVTFRLPAGAIRTIGRSAGAQFKLDAALVSRLHCQLTATGDSLQVKDLGSTNGTYVNGERIEQAALKPGDTLSIGRVALVVSRAS